MLSTSPAKQKQRHQGQEQIISFHTRKITAITWSGFPKQVMRAVTRKGVLNKQSRLCPLHLISYILKIKTVSSSQET